MSILRGKRQGRKYLAGGVVPSNSRRISRGGSGQLSLGATPRSNTRHNRFGPGFQAPLYGSFAGRDNVVAGNVITVDAPATITVTGQSATIKQANIVTVTGVRYFPTTHPATIIQAGQIIRVTNVASSTITGRTANISQFDPSTNLVQVGSPAATTLTGNAPQILRYNKLIVQNTMGGTLVGRGPTIIPGVLGESTLSQADIVKIWNGIHIDGYSPMEILRYLAAVMAGKVTGAGTGTETFLSINPNNQVPRVRSKTDSNGNRTQVELL